MLTITTETRRFVLKEDEEQSERKFNEIIRRLLEPQEGKADIGKPQETENANRQQEDNCGCNKEFTEPLIPMYVNCECGGRFRYMTNKKEEMFDMTCIECGAPVPMRYNGKKNCYETIKD